MKVGIRFSDNDYTYYTKAFIELYILPEFVEREEGHYVTHLTSAMVVDAFNKFMPHLYKFLAHERGRYYEGVSAYFCINEMNVYWDDNTDLYIKEWTGWNNSEFVWTNGKDVYIS